MYRFMKKNLFFENSRPRRALKSASYVFTIKCIRRKESRFDSSYTLRVYTYLNTYIYFLKIFNILCKHIYT